MADSAEVPAEPSRADLAYWLSAVDVMPAVYAEAAQAESEVEDDGDGDDELDSDLMDADLDADKALADSLAGLVRSLGGILAPASSRLSDQRRQELQGEANRAWQLALPLVRRLEDALAERGRTAAALAQLRRAEQGTRRLDKAEQKYRDAEMAAKQLLTEVIKRGLERRVGLYLREEYVLLRLLALGGEFPAGIAVCEGDGCGLVFRPIRRYAAKCPRCHNKPHTPALQYERRDDGGYVLHSPIGALRTHHCEVCGERFNPSRADARACPSCKRRRNRESARRSRATQR